jgi:hypothetical protein
MITELPISYPKDDPAEISFVTGGRYDSKIVIFVGPTGEPAFITRRNQGQIVLIGASVVEVPGGFIAVGHTLDRSDGTTTVWKLGSRRPVEAYARSEAQTISENA